MQKKSASPNDALRTNECPHSMDDRVFTNQIVYSNGGPQMYCSNCGKNYYFGEGR